MTATPPPLQGSNTTPRRRIAILSCIHGNMAALEAVWDDLNAQDVDSVYCLGDLVGYGPFPNDCLLYTSPSPRDGLLSRMPSSA